MQLLRASYWVQLLRAVVWEKNWVQDGSSFDPKIVEERIRNIGKLV